MGKQFQKVQINHYETQFSKLRPITVIKNIIEENEKDSNLVHALLLHASHAGMDTHHLSYILP